MPKARWGSGDEALTDADLRPKAVDRKRKLLREKVLVLFSEEQLEQIDLIARLRKVNRSELIRAAVLADVGMGPNSEY